MYAPVRPSCASTMPTIWLKRCADFSIAAESWHLGVLADQRLKRDAPAVVEVGRLPVHPLLDVCALDGIRRQQVGTSTTHREVPNDDIRLPDDDTGVIDHRHHADRIECPEFWVLGRAKTAGPIFTLEGQPEFVTNPEHLANVDGCRVSIDSQHQQLHFPATVQFRRRYQCQFPPAIATAAHRAKAAQAPSQDMAGRGLARRQTVSDKRPVAVGLRLPPTAGSRAGEGPWVERLRGSPHPQRGLRGELAAFFSPQMDL